MELILYIYKINFIKRLHFSHKWSHYLIICHAYFPLNLILEFIIQAKNNVYSLFTWFAKHHGVFLQLFKLYLAGLQFTVSTSYSSRWLSKMCLIQKWLIAISEKLSNMVKCNSSLCACLLSHRICSDGFVNTPVCILPRIWFNHCLPRNVSLDLGSLEIRYLK